MKAAQVKSTSAAFFISGPTSAASANKAGRHERERSTRSATRLRSSNEPRQQPRRRPGMIFDNQIVDDARGRARDRRKSGDPRPRLCSRSRSGDGACLKHRRCWFDSRREHCGSGLSIFAVLSDSDRMRMVIAHNDPEPPGPRSGIGLVSKTGQRGSIPRQPA